MIPAGVKAPVLQDIFLRRYTATTRPFIPLHCDHAAVTLNVCLSGHENDKNPEAGALQRGGQLVALHADSVRVLHRGEGEATAHTSALLHGVTRIHQGERHTMILFYEYT